MKKRWNRCYNVHSQVWIFFSNCGYALINNNYVFNTLFVYSYCYEKIVAIITEYYNMREIRKNTGFDMVQ